ncbi:MAG: CBS domain-containing protein [Cyanobacteria bacterium P01_C01_bin.69]
MPDQTLTSNDSLSDLFSEGSANVNQEPVDQGNDLEELFGMSEDPMTDDVWDLEADLEASLSQIDEQKTEKPVAVKVQVAVDEKRAEAMRQAEVAKKAEAMRQAEAVRQAEAARQAEAVKQAEAARQAKAARQQAETAKQAEVARQQAEVARQQAEVARQAEVAKQAEAARQQAEAARQAEAIVEVQAIEAQTVEAQTVELQIAVNADIEEEATIDGWERIEKVAKKVFIKKQEVRVSLKTLLGWFGAKRRGSAVKRRIQKELEKRNIRIEPDFANASLHTVVRFMPVEDAFGDTADEFEDPTFRISQLSSADMRKLSTDPDSRDKDTTTLICVKPDHSVQEATTLMMLHDFSQLPVMTTSRDVKGVISWESIGKHTALSNKCEKVKDCMVKTVPEVTSDSSMFSAIELIVRHGFVLVRQQHDKVISGIVTTTDLSLQFRQLAEPFLLVGEIENYLRSLIEGFTSEQLQSALDPCDKKCVESAADLNFGAYVRLLGNPDNWKLLDIPIDRKIFRNRLEKIRKLRNEIMHFDPDPFDEKDLETLRLFANFIRTVYINKKA